MSDDEQFIMYLNVRFSIRLDNGKLVFFVRKDYFFKAQKSRVFEHLRRRPFPGDFVSMYDAVSVVFSRKRRSPLDK